MSDRLSLNDLRVQLAEGQVRSAAARYLGELEGNPIRDREDPDAGDPETVVDLLFRRSMDRLGKGKDERAILRRKFTPGGR